jgi:predicted porin
VTVTAYAVAESTGGDNYGLDVDYAEGPLEVGVSYANEQGTDIAGVEGSYDVGNGLEVLAGYLTEEGNEDRFYVAGNYDLGGGGSLLVSYADDDDDVDGDEVGVNDYQRGTTVEVAFEF